MFHKAYTLLDSKTGIYSQPVYFATDGAAVRSIIELGLDTNTMVGRHPSDYVLYSIGGFDDNTGMFQSLEVFSFGTVASLIARPSNQPEA